MEEEGRPTREISSVIMTTSGYISPAREGKLPESRTPLAAIEVAPPPPNNTNVAPPIINPKPLKVVKKVEKKRERIGKELFKPGDEKVKKAPTAKEIAKLKQAKNVNNVNNTQQLIHNLVNNSEIKLIPTPVKQMANKTLAAARLKTEKLNTTITPIPMKPAQPPNDNIDKLFTEPDKKKVNILKKISYGKNEKVESKGKVKDEMKQESREGSPVLIIDEPVEQPKVHISNDITIELVDPAPVNKTPEKPEKTNCYDDSPPGTPLTPKTPEISHSPPLSLSKGRAKRKDKTKVKKVPKVNLSFGNPDNDIDVDVRPKTPEAQLDKHVMLALGLAPYTPGLIPPPVNPFFPNMQLRFPGFGKPPFMPLLPSYPMEFQPPMMRKELPILPPRPPLEKPQLPVLPLPPPPPPIVVVDEPPPKPEKKTKEHKKEKKDKVRKKNKKDKVKDKAEKKKLKEEKKDKEKVKKEKKEKKKEKELQCREIDSIPKLTLKLGSPAPTAESNDTRKLNIKPIVKKEEEPPVINNDQTREMSPELAKISALVTGQPKPKNTQNNIANDNFGTSSDSFHNQMKKTMFKPIPKKEVIQEPVNFGLSNPTPSSYIDSEGNEVWICPGCDKQDDGSPMIGCDDCDAWYHWVCVGIQVPPDDNENW
ncbi:PHD finger motif containing protein, partial [Oryctes borbonicus]